MDLNQVIAAFLLTIFGMIAFIFFTKGEENFNLYKFSFFFIVLPFIFYQFIFYIL